MDWINQVRGVLGRYADRSPETPGKTPGAQHIADDSAVHRDFEVVVSKAPRASCVRAIADMFRSPGTPPFSDMVAHLFRESSPEQKAELLRRLISTAPASAPDDVLRLLGPNKDVKPEDTGRIAPQMVKRIAEEVVKHDPSVIERVSEYYADHPRALTILGIKPLVTFMQMLGAQLAERRSGGGAGA